MSRFELDLTTYNATFIMISISCSGDTADSSYGGSVISGCGQYDMRTSNGLGNIPPTVGFNHVAEPLITVS
jgi:hypothetical protein